jgi:hypothetical protein
MGKSLYFIETLQEWKRLTEQFDSSKSLVLAKRKTKYKKPLAFSNSYYFCVYLTLKPNQFQIIILNNCLLKKKVQRSLYDQIRKEQTNKQTKENSA